MKLIFFLPVFFQSVFAINSNWWKHSEIYDVFVWSFKDSNSDGFGDLKGLISKLDYIQETGFKIIKLSPIFPSPEDISNSYGVVNFKGVHPTLGTFKDFDELIEKTKYRGIKVILDIIIGHCHVTHEWFEKSIKKIEPYADYFIWEDPKNSQDENKLPNQWVNSIGHPAWRWNSNRKQYYYNHFNHFLPNLNLKNKELKNEIESIFRFWLNKGISGFNILALEAFEGKDNDLKHTENMKLVTELVHELRTYVNNFSKENGDYERIIMFPEDNDPIINKEFLGDEKNPGVHLLSKNLNQFSFLEYTIQHFPTFFIKTLFTTISTIKEENVEWVLESGTHSRLSDKQIEAVLTMIFLTLPGTTRILYGQEIGMNEYKTFPIRNINEKVNFKNAHVLPMQWDGSMNAGFTTSDAPVQVPNPDYRLINVDKQKSDSSSMYNMIKYLLKVRRRNTMKFGDVKINSLSKFVFAFTRTHKKHESYITIINFDNIFKEVDLTKIEGLPSIFHFLVGTPNSYYKRGDVINSKLPLLMGPMSSVLMAYK